MRHDHWQRSEPRYGGGRNERPYASPPRRERSVYGAYGLRDEPAWNAGHDGDQERARARDYGAYERGSSYQPDVPHASLYDPDYDQWRRDHMNALDNDYHRWRTERYQKFSDDFNNWRQNRPVETGTDTDRSRSTTGSGASGSTGGTGSAKP